MTKKVSNFEEKIEGGQNMKNSYGIPIMPWCDTPIFEEIEQMVMKFYEKYHSELDKKINGEKGVVGTEENFAELQDIVISKSYAYISHKLNNVIGRLTDLLELLEEDDEICKKHKSQINKMQEKYEKMGVYIYNYVYPLGIAYVSLENKNTLKEYAELSFAMVSHFLPYLDKICEEYISYGNNLKKYATKIKEIESSINDIKKDKKILFPQIKMIISKLNTIYQIILLDENEINGIKKMFM